jgi:tetratricopeptide (TPR) repeat protein
MLPARSRTLLQLLSLAALVALPACQDDASKVSEHMARGQDFVKDEQYREAIIEFKSALQIEPNNADAHYQLAHAFLNAKKVREGFWELRETVRLDESNHDAKLEFSQLAILAGEKDEALAQAQSVVDADPSNVTAHLMVGQALDSLGRPDEALAAYREGLAADPEDQTALQTLAKALMQRDLLEESEAQYVELTELHPSFEAYSALARVIRKSGEGRVEDQEAALRKALELAEGEDRITAYAQLGSLYKRRGRLDEAIALLENGIQNEQDESKVRLIYLLAGLYRGEGDFAKADELIERTATESPDDPRVYLVLAAYRVRKNNLEGALEAANRAVELAPDDKRAKLQKAEILMELGYRGERDGGVEEARTLLDGILAAEPTNPAALLADAKLRLGAGDAGGAISSIQRALEARPQWAQAHYLMGLAFGAQRQYAEARNQLAQALEIDDSLVDAKQVLAQVHFRLGEWEYCVERGRQYLKENPDSTKTRLYVAQSLVRLGRIKEAEKELGQIPEDQRDGEVLYAMGRIQLGLNNVDGARTLLLAAHDELPSNPDILENLLRIDGGTPRYAEAKERLTKAVEADPDNAKLQQLAGRVAVADGRVDEGEAMLKKAIELDPEDMSGYETLARLYARTGRLEDAGRIYEQALEVKPGEAQLHHMLGMLYELSGDRDRAIERYEDAIRYRPDFAEAKNNLAYIYAESGKNLDRALDLAQDAKALLPDSPSVADTLGWVLYKRGVPSAAISYLKEAESRTDAGDASLGEVRFHLAQAYVADGQGAEAMAALDRSLEALDSHMAAIKERGGKVDEPAWAAEARALREQVSTSQTAGG